MNEETIKMLNVINNKIEECKEDNNVKTMLAIPLGGHGEFGYLTDKMLNEIIATQQENARLKEIENKLNFIKNRVKQGMSQENINKCAIELVNSYLKEN